MAGLTSWLLAGLLLLPLTGAVLARLAGRRWGQQAMRLIGGGAFVGALGCLFALQQAPLDEAAIGGMSIFLPSRQVVVAQDSLVTLPTAPPTSVPEPTPAPTATLAPQPTTPPTVEPANTPTPAPTEPPPPTEAPPTPTAAPPPPTEAPPQPQPTRAPAQAQRYVVESGDTLRGIASRFDVSVEALLRFNGLSEEEGDSLRVGQELFIPPR